MNVYVWEEIQEATDNYHSEGGVVVFADTLVEARSLAEAMGVRFHPDEFQPDEVRSCGGEEKKVFLFPNAGCC